jgi:hypothetical protein
MNNENKQMLLDLGKKEIKNLTETLNYEISKIQINISKEDLEKLSQLSIKINDRIEQLKTILISN